MSAGDRLKDKNVRLKAEDLLRAHDDMIAHYYDRWSFGSMPTPKKKPTKVKHIPLTMMPMAQATVDNGPDDTELAEMLGSRMRWGTKDHSFNDVLVRCTGEIANVILVTEKEVMVIKDELNLFPSDALVTQLRLLGA